MGRFIARLAACLVAGVIGFLAPAYVGGIYYSFCGDRPFEQRHLDGCIYYLTVLRNRCNDPELQGILDYTITRYHKVGPWDVMFIPLSNPLFAGPEYKTLGYNCPWCPGVTLDTDLLLRPVREGALVLVHEALHDYWPYLGHSYVDPVMKRIEAL
jgi:hypothetical protein